MATPGDSKRRRTAAYERGWREGIAEAAQVAELDVDWTRFGKPDVEQWEGGPDALRDYRIGIASGRAIAASIRTLDKRLEKPGKGETG